MGKIDYIQKAIDDRQTACQKDVDASQCKAEKKLKAMTFQGTSENIGYPFSVLHVQSERGL